MRAALSLAVLLLMTGPASAQTIEAAPTPREEVQSDLSTREISIQSNFTGIEILIYGSVDFSQTKAPDQGVYDVIIVIRSPSQPLVARRKERAGRHLDQRARAESFRRCRASMPRCRPVRSGPSPPTRRSRQLGVGLANLAFRQAQPRRSRRGDVSLGGDPAEREAEPVSGARRRRRLYRPQPVPGDRRPAGQRPDRPLYRRRLPVPRRPAREQELRARSR